MLNILATALHCPATSKPKKIFWQD